MSHVTTLLNYARTSLSFGAILFRFPVEHQSMLCRYIDRTFRQSTYVRIDNKQKVEE